MLCLYILNHLMQHLKFILSMFEGGLIVMSNNLFAERLTPENSLVIYIPHLTLCVPVRVDSIVSWHVSRRLLHQFNLTRSPEFVVPRLSRAVETQNNEPTLAGNSLGPVRLLAGRCLWAEVEIDRPVVVHDHFVLVANVVVAGERLTGLEL